MKKVFYSISTILLAAAALSLSSCLKDSRYVDLSNVGTLVELPLAAYNGGSSIPVPEAYNISTTPADLKLVVNVAAPKPLSTPLNVTLGLDPVHLDSLNHTDTTSATGSGIVYSILPTADYSISSWTVTIPANQNTATVDIKINTSLIDPSQSYVLPIKIVSASGQKISNYGYILFAVQVKNKYDGEYTVTGSMKDITNANLTGAYPFNVDLITQSANSVYMYSLVYGGPAHDILSGGSGSYYGYFAPVFVFDPTTNAVTSVVNYPGYGQPAPDTRSARIDVTGINALTGTPGTVGSKIQVKYVMVQANDGGDRTFFDETFTYIGPR